VPIVVTQSGVQYIELGWGGTSLGCPIFSAFWALANQSAGHALGQAAPHLAKATSSELTDIVPHTSPTNPSGIIFDSQFGSTYYSPSDLFSDALSLGTATEFVSGIWPVTGAHYLQAFGLDSSLTVTKGWDNVTGFGAPNGLAFIQGIGK
jgi:subtilase family serine protease